MRFFSSSGEFAFFSFGSSAKGIVAVGGMAYGVVAIGGILSVGVISIGMNAVGSVAALGLNAAGPISLSLISADAARVHESARLATRMLILHPTMTSRI